MNQPRPQCVLLDLYETLAHADLDRILAGRSDIAARLGVPAAALAAAYEATATRRFLGRYGSAVRDMAAVLETAGISADQALLEEVAEIEQRLWLDNVRLYPEVDGCLEDLRARGQRLGLLSNCGYQTRPLVDAWGLDRRMDAVVLSHEVRLAKPDPAIYRLALDRLGAEPADAFFIDDQVAFLDAAADLGMSAFLLRRTDAPPSSRHAVISSLTDLL